MSDLASATQGACGVVCALEDLFHRPADWERARLDLQTRLQLSLESLALPSEGASLLAWLQRLDGLQRELGRLSTYVGVQGFVDTRDTRVQADSTRLRELSAGVARLSVALTSHLAAAHSATWETWERAAPGLAAYRGKAELYRQGRQHYLTADTEQALAALDSSLQLPVQVYRRIKAGDLRFAEVVDQRGRQQRFTLPLFEKRFETSHDAMLRSSAQAVFAEAVKPHQHAFAAAYAGEVGRQVSLARLRGFSSTVDFLFWQQGVPSSYFASQRSVFNTGLAPLMRRFVDVKRRLLGLDRLSFHDLKAYPPQLAGTLTLDEARTAIVAAGHRLGSEYAGVLQRAFDERWIEHGQQPNKADSSGCASPFGPHPYVLMTWTGTPRDLFLLAHELGHAVHFYWSHTHQSALNSAPLRYFIEAPSTLNELLLAQHLLETGDEQQRLLAVFELLNSYYHNFVTHYLESEFQYQVYQTADNGVLPGAEALQRIKLDVLRGFWGDAVDIDADAGLTWLRQQHYYMGLYPYTYAAGQSIASLFLPRLANDPRAAGQWCELLRQGSSQSAQTLLDSLGLNMADPRSFHQVLTIIDHWVELFEQLTQPLLNDKERT
ncbi:hypothetical protein K5Q02_23460 [Pseudomonas sp. MM211]|uniref:M3 family metallopeptidase n=1 Tax=Pseudomonas sp. MM211 TaxID=2866808 RepID=UPI001CEDD341|nr:M3 family metallopeptidase [Pseudomonas sp. MM211]UCJ16693.1 hypothetical protein K5Q02_23460 [Pseudomonas sp. MM211]